MFNTLSLDKKIFPLLSSNLSQTPHSNTAALHPSMNNFCSLDASPLSNIGFLNDSNFFNPRQNHNTLFEDCLLNNESDCFSQGGDQFGDLHYNNQHTFDFDMVNNFNPMDQASQIDNNHNLFNYIAEQKDLQINPIAHFDEYFVAANFFFQNTSHKILPEEEEDVKLQQSSTLKSIKNNISDLKCKAQIGVGSTIKKSKDYDKNICRYIARLIVRQFNNSEYKEKIIELTDCSEAEYVDAKKYFLHRIQLISGHRVFRDFILVSKEDDDKLKEFQKIFRLFSKWFLRERAVRYIIQGDMKDQMSYIKYKNDIMLYYIDCPEKWESNKCLKKKRYLRKN